VGKTRLAMAISHDVDTYFASGIIFVDLAPVDSASLLPSAVAQHLGMSESESGSVTEQIVAFLRPRQSLILLDNCEHLIASAAEFVVAILVGCPAVQVLATSRAPLRIRGERVLPVPPLALPASATHDVADADQFGAVTLFIERAQAADARFAPTATQTAAVIEICRRLDGLPLAIEVTAAWIKALPPAALLARLDQRRLELTGGLRDLPDRQQTLRATIAWSYNLLSPDVQRLFRQLAVFAGAFDLAALDELHPAGTDAILRGIATLLEQSLLERVPHDDVEPRFRMLETIRAFGREVLAVSGEEAQVRRAYATYYLTLAETAHAHFMGPDQLVWFDILEADYDNLRAALTWALDERERSVALRLAWKLEPFWSHRNRLSEGIHWLERVLRELSQEDDAERAMALDAAGRLMLHQGHNEDAKGLFDEAYAIRRCQQDHRGIARSLQHLGMVAFNRSDFAQARVRFEEAMALQQAIGEPSELAWLHDSLGIIAREQGDLERATALTQRALTLYRDQGNLRGIGNCLHSLGRIADARFAFSEASSLFEEALALQRQIGEAAAIAITLEHLAELSRVRGDFDRATTLLEEARSLFFDAGMQWGVAEISRALGWIAYDRSDFVAATSLFEEAVTIQRTLDDSADLADSLVGMGRVVNARGEPDRATAFLMEALALYQDVGQDLGSAEALSTLGNVVRAQGDLHRAAALATQALVLHLRLGEQEELIFALESVAATATALGRSEQAARFFAAAQARRETMGVFPTPTERADYERLVHTIQSQLDTATYAAVTAFARTAPLDALVAEAKALGTPIGDLASTTPIPTIVANSHVIDDRFELTAREHDVLRLICQRLTNKEIAEALYVGARTVQSHTISIFTKLGVDNRRDAAALAVRHGLA
jgi:predicted ATPase/DNA-binding CsgD family transcriptional regulator/uncharacterized protein HemY